MKKYNIKVNGISYEVEVEEVGGDSVSVQNTIQVAKPIASAAPVVNTNSSGNSIKAPMPGTIVKINSKAGDTLKKGDVVLVLEAMKMENDITAPCDCTISSINVNQGASVSTGDILVTYN